MNSSTVELVQSGATEDILRADLLRDFYQSFRLSQFETAIQPPLFTRLAYMHEAAAHTALLPTALQQANASVDKMMPPARHAPTSEGTRNNKETGFRAMWNEYSAILLDPSKGIYRPDEYVLDDMLVRDEHYQDPDTPRPNRTAGSDPHESIVREYILGAKLTGSDQLLQVRANLKNSLLNPSEEHGEYMVERLQSVIEKWEINHSGESFMLSAYVQVQ